MDILLDAIVPIMLIVFSGWILGYSKLVDIKISGALMQYVFYAAIPAAIFYALSSNPIHQLIYWPYWIAYILYTVIVVTITALFFKFILRRSGFVSLVAGYAASMANTLIIGYPIVYGFFGHFAAFPLAISVILFICFFVPSLIFINELNQNSTESSQLSQAISHAIMTTIKNPIIIGTALGIIVSLMNIHLPDFINKFVNYLGESVVPCALFAVGLELADFKKSGNLVDVSIITFFNLILAPLVAIAVALLMHLSAKYAVTLVIFATVPTAKTLYVIASKYQAYNKEIAAVVSLTTVLSMITIIIFTLATKVIWPTAF